MGRFLCMPLICMHMELIMTICTSRSRDSQIPLQVPPNSSPCQINITGPGIYTTSSRQRAIAHRCRLLRLLSRPLPHHKRGVLIDLLPPPIHDKHRRLPIRDQRREDAGAAHPSADPHARGKGVGMCLQQARRGLGRVQSSEVRREETRLFEPEEDGGGRDA